MTPFDSLLQFLANIIPSLTIWSLIKIMFLIMLFLYIAFALIITRQVGLMSKTLDGEFASPVKVVAWIHLLAAVGVFLLALTIL